MTNLRSEKYPSMSPKRGFLRSNFSPSPRVQQRERHPFSDLPKTRELCTPGAFFPLSQARAGIAGRSKARGESRRSPKVPVTDTLVCTLVFTAKNLQNQPATPPVYTVHTCTTHGGIGKGGQRCHKGVGKYIFIKVLPERCHRCHRCAHPRFRPPGEPIANPAKIHPQRPTQKSTPPC